MITKDWIAEASNRIAALWPEQNHGRGEGYVTDEQRAAISNAIVLVIAAECPFKPDAAYIEVVPHKSGAIYDWAARAAIYLSAERLPSTHRIAAVISHFAEPLVKALKGSRREHYHCEDSFYCCPRCKHSDHGTNDAGDIWNPDMKCICGADELNERIDKVLQGEPK